MHAPALILFDIDGTLLRRSGPQHRQALVDAVRGVTGLDTTTDHIPVQGMLDRDILTWMLRDTGASAARIRHFMPQLVQRAQWLYSRRCPADLSDKVCPGVVDLLGELRARKHVAGLVSGNLTQIGWKKMERAGLKPYFRYGAFADRGRTRAELCGIAVREARANGWISRRTPVALIGDHPNDIDAARRNGVRSVAVATGLSPRAELAAHRPDLLVDDLCGVTLESLFA